MPKDISNPEKGGKITLYEGKELYPTITVLRPNQGDVSKDLHTNIPPQSRK